MAAKEERRTLLFERPVYFASYASAAAGEREARSKYAKYFTVISDDDTLGEKSYEKTEQMLYKTAVISAINRSGIQLSDVDMMLGGDLLNQIISSSFTARELEIPFLGLYGACSAICESILIGGMIVDGGYANNVICAASSHFATAERQFRQPLEMGTPRVPTSQITVSASGATLLSNHDLMGCNIIVSGGTVGKVIDLGIKDGNNMGGAMAPACADTILANLEDTSSSVSDYDMIITGDLGSFGSDILYDLLLRCGVDITKRHIDCGKEIFAGQPDINCGASGCGCAASMLNSYVIKSVIAGGWKKILFIATGALLSRTSSLQGESIPSIAHAVMITRL